MKKGFRKIGAVLLTFAMALAMNSTVFAAVDLTNGDPNGHDLGTWGSFVTADSETYTDTTDEAVKIYKAILAYNKENTTVNAPTIRYGYSIELVNTPANITDANSVSVTTKTSVTSGTPTITDYVSFAPGGTSPVVATLSASDNNTNDANFDSNKQDVVVDFSSVVFGAAGVYRYKITEAITSGTSYGTVGYGNSGVVEDTNSSHYRFLDVYVRDDTTASGAAEWVVYGFTLFDTGSDNASNIANVTTASSTYKTDRFGMDEYYTYNVSIEKVLENDSFNNSHQFPFNVSFTKDAQVDGVLPIIQATGTATVPSTWTSGSIGSGSSSFDVAVDATTFASDVKIANGGVVTINGIPAGTTVTFSECNDVIGTTYAVSTANGSTNIDPAENKGYTATSTNFTATSTVDTLNDAVDITITNAMVLISPTGFAVRFAPYALVLLGGILLIAIGLLVYNKTNKKETA